MKLIVILLAIFVACNARATTYLVDTASGMVVRPLDPDTKYAGGVLKGKGFRVRATGRSLVVADYHPEFDKPADERRPLFMSDLSGIVSSDPLTEASFRAYHQGGKSTVHKKADKALIKLLIKEGYLPAGSTSIPAGTIAAFREAVLDDENNGNGNAHGKAARIEQYIRIIERAGGDPEDAIDHAGL